MTRYRLIIDVEKCEDCNNCFLACKDEHVGNTWPGYTDEQPVHGQRWIDILRRERGQYPLIDVAYRPTPCMHCDDAPCREYAPQAVTKRPDGIVLIDPEAARGDEGLVASCPYGAIWWNEEKRVAQKCTMCAHLLDEGYDRPRCVQACPTGALVFETVDETANETPPADGSAWLHPELDTKPIVYYRNLYRFEKDFIAGSVAFQHPDGNTVDCAKGAQVVLLRGSEELGAAESDAFGDFKFDGLEPDSGSYQVRVSMPGMQTETREVRLGGSQSLPTIVLVAQEEAASA